MFKTSQGLSTDASKKDQPRISIVIPTYNEERNIGNCLDSIFSQQYPTDLLEVIVVDNYSSDKTIELVKGYDVKILYNKIRDAEVSKMVGLIQSRGDFFLYLDADIQLVGEDWLRRIARPLEEAPEIVGSFPRFLPKKDDLAIGRFLRYHPLELDPVLEFFCTDIKETVVARGANYNVCKFRPPKVPPIGICLYRRNPLVRTIGSFNKFMDIDVPVILSESGYDKFAYVPDCGIYHTNVRTIRDLLNRRLRNLRTTFLPELETRKFRYFRIQNVKDLTRILLWIFYANLLIPSLAKGIRKSVKHGDIACMYEPVVALLLTDLIIWELWRDEKGRTAIKSALMSSLKSTFVLIQEKHTEWF